MKRFFLTFLLLLLAGLLFAQVKPKNIILLIGDGMGPNQERMLQLLAGESAALRPENFSGNGCSRTYSLNDSITDSAAGGSALATGVKTNNGSIACNPDGTPNESLLDWAVGCRMRTGLIVSSSITDATPASFYAHVKSRKQHYDIAKYLVDSKIDFVVGGGYHYFCSQNRPDKQHLVDTLRARGYQMVAPGSNVDLSAWMDTVPLPVVAWLANKNPDRASARGKVLAQSVKQALAKLSGSENGFFLIVEGSQIDWACHVNDGNYLAEELLDFDEVVAAALAFAEADGETLVVVTADHETGGCHYKRALSDNAQSAKKVKRSVAWRSFHHSSIDVNVHAFGPAAETFNGRMENTAIPQKIVDSAR